MNHKKIGIIFVILLLAAAIPFRFTATPGLYLFGWLPVSLAYWWILMVVNLVFVLWVCRSFVKDAERKNQKKQEQEDKQDE